MLFWELVSKGKNNKAIENNIYIGNHGLCYFSSQKYVIGFDKMNGLR